MTITRALAAAGCAALALVAVAAGRAAEPRADAAGRAAEPGDPAEYVVTYDGDADQVRRAVAEAGGTVEDVNRALGVALVSATGAGFPDRIAAEPAVTGVARNHSVGTSRPGQPHRFVAERPSAADRAAVRDRGTGAVLPLRGADTAEPLADRQWDMAMIGADADRAHRHATGRGVRVGIIDTGVDAAHPDLAPNLDVAASRNFTTDIPSVDGPCEVPSCVDPAGVDEGGHGTHVAGIVAAARNDVGIAGVAPDATIVDVRAGQDSGYFFLYETVAALTYAADIGLDVVNMSFYVDPWLYNCSSRSDYRQGTVSDEELGQQRLTRTLVTRALEYAHARGVTLVAAAGNSGADLAAPERLDGSSPDYPPGAARPRTVSRDCLDLPSEGPHVISVSSVGPSEAKADYANYGLGAVELAAPGGYLDDLAGTPQHQAPANMVLSSYPLAVARAEGLVDARGEPVDAFSARSCDAAGACGVYTYLQGTSMAAPHVAGVAALVVEAHGEPARDGHDLDPDDVAEILARTARDHACPAGAAACQGTPAVNGYYGEGIVDAGAAVAPVSTAR